MKTFAIIPAAGRSERMGQPKLLLPWDGATVIEHVLAVWRAARVDEIVMVVHPLDDELAKLGRAGGARVIQPPTPPVDMKASVRIGLQDVATRAPQPADPWLLAPADMPGLNPRTITRLVEAYAARRSEPTPPARIWAPSHAGRRGHPVLFPWSLAAEVARLADDEGINALLGRHPVETVPVEEAAIPEDLDTPEDYHRLRKRHGLD